MKRIALIAAAVCTFAAASPAAAAIVQFTDRLDFEAAAGALTLQDFESYAGTTNLAPATDLGAFTVSTNGSAAIAPFGSVDGTQDLQVNITADTGSGGPGLITFTFDTAIFAFGADFNSLNNNVIRTFATVGGTVFSPLPLSPSFLGFVSTTGFTTVTFSNPMGGGNNDSFQLDNLAYSQAGGVPEPATWGLMIAGFGGIGVMARRRRQGLAAA
jgi:hypothetical protein